MLRAAFKLFNIYNASTLGCYIMKWLSKKCFLEITGIINLVLRSSSIMGCSQELSSQVSAFSFWGSSLIFLLGALSISPLTDARVCVRELLTAFEVIHQLMSKTNWIFINSLASLWREISPAAAEPASEFSSCQLGVWNARRIIRSYQNSLNSFGAERKLTQSD